ncbi:hypothetical protein NYE69_28425 [Paenibacillus sp. FSL R5-0527]|uniref:hypothetical protein n=1 Tax=Paenibacillus sp. FSL R5-0527 TaxID=2975321 RepID=UPI00097A9528|nr:hypothetical protein BK140_10975 [Paenibacillus macerans]
MSRTNGNECFGTPPKGESAIKEQSPATSYASLLRESGLFELHEKVTLKLKVIEQLDQITRFGDIDIKKELYAVIESMLLDLGVAVIKDDEQCQ